MTQIKKIKFLIFLFSNSEAINLYNAMLEFAERDIMILLITADNMGLLNEIHTFS